MPEISVTLPDGSSLAVSEGATVRDVAEKIGARLAAAALAGRVDGRMVDIGATVTDGARVEIITERSPEALELLRHSAAHVMAEAVKQLFPLAKFGIGPAIDEGFYYDIQIDRTFTPDDLGAIEERMRAIVAEALAGEPLYGFVPDAGLPLGFVPATRMAA